MGCHCESYWTSFDQRVRIVNDCTGKVVASGFIDFDTCNYKRINTYQSLCGDCAPSLTISGLRITDKGSNMVEVTWIQNISGKITVLDNDIPVFSGVAPEGQSGLTFTNINGTHTFCVIPGI